MTKAASRIPLKTMVKRIQSAYLTATARIVEVISRLDPASFTDVDSGRAMADIREAVEVLNLQIHTFAPEAIRAAYEKGAGVARTRLEMVGAEPSSRYNQARPEKKIEAVSKLVLRDYWKANRTIEKTARQYLAALSQAAAGVKRVEQAQMFEAAEVASFIKKMVVGALVTTSKYNAGTAHLTSQQLAAKILAKLLRLAKGGDFIIINGRNYNLKSYAELVARTRMREAQTEAVKEMAREYENDLVFIPPHDDPCESICAEYQGQVYSVSGNHPKYPELPDGGPPWHPNCECSMNPTSENALAWK